MKLYGIIYKITNLVDNKCYIGQTTKELEHRWSVHKSSTKYKISFFYNSIKKYGVENFKIEKLCECESREILDIMETFMIMIHHSHRSENGYNLTWGGCGISVNAKEKLSKINKGKKLSEEHKKKLSDSHKGYIPSELTRIKMGLSRKGKKHTQQSKLKISNKNKGKIKSEETKKILSDINKGKKLSEETKRKIGLASIGRFKSEETKRKIGEKSKLYWSEKRMMCNG